MRLSESDILILARELVDRHNSFWGVCRRTEGLWSRLQDPYDRAVLYDYLWKVKHIQGGG